MAKINKKNTEDVFSGLKYVDKLLNEAAGVGNPPKKLTFEEKMKLKLKEGADEAEDLDEMTTMNDSMDELEEEDLNEYNYNYPHTGSQAEGGSDTLFGEDEMEEDFVEPGMEDDDEMEMSLEFPGEDDHFSHKIGGAAKHAFEKDLPADMGGMNDREGEF